MPALSILDLAPVADYADHSDALAATTALAQRADQLGYRRFWVAEHHAMPAIASSAPAVLIAHLAAATSTIRVGSGGVMLPNHPPLVVAEQFGMLESLHPGRIDLGIGRAPGTDQRTALALRRTMEGLSAEHFPEELLALIGMLSGDPQFLPATPRGTDLPQIWLLGSSGFSAQLAAALGLPFSFAHHFSSRNTEAAVALYRDQFRPSQYLEAPRVMVAVNAVLADTDERAAYLAKPGIISFLRLRTGAPQALMHPDEAARYAFSPAEQDFARERATGQLLGSPETARRQLDALIAATRPDEIMATCQIYDRADRIKSFELLADVTELSAAR